MSCSKPASVHSSHFRHHHHLLEEPEDVPSESSPLITNNDPQPNYLDGQQEGVGEILAAPALPRGRRERWAIASALALLVACVMSVLCVAFIVPAASQRYAETAVALDVSSLALDSFTSEGVRVHVKANVDIDADRVDNKAVRVLGRVGSYVLGSVNVREFELRVLLPEYGNALLGTAVVPAMSIDIRDGHTNSLDFLTDTKPGSLDVIELLAKDFISGSLKTVKVIGEVDIQLGKGILTLGPTRILREFILQGQGELKTTSRRQRDDGQAAERLTNSARYSHNPVFQHHPHARRRGGI